MLYRLSFKANPDLIVEAPNAEAAPEVAIKIHELEGEPTSEVVAIVAVTTLGQIFS